VVADWLGQGGRIGGLVLNEREWFNIGSRAEYLAVHQHIASGAWKPGYVTARDWPARVHPSAKIAPGADVSGFTVVGAGTAVGENVHLDDCVIWEDAEIVAGASLRNCVVTSGRRVEGTHTDADI
jgi:mannose-1-phosphate guanylyltransferase